jgi:predicted amidohydrolase
MGDQAISEPKLRKLHPTQIVQVGLPFKDADGMHYNSVCFATPAGVSYYHKSHLFETDETWADEGPGFKCFITSLGKVSPSNVDWSRDLHGY